MSISGLGVRVWMCELTQLTETWCIASKKSTQTLKVKMRHRQVVWWIWWSWKLEPGIAQNRADLRSGSISKSKSPKATCNFNYPHLMATSFYVWVRFLKWWFQSLTHLWFFDCAPIMTGLAWHAHGYNRSTNIIRITNHSLIEFKSLSTRGNPYLETLLGQESRFFHCYAVRR